MEEEQKQKSEQVVVKNKKGFGITSMVLGIISILFCWSWFLGGILEIMAIIFGIVGIVKKKGKGMAIAGLVCGSIALFITAVSSLPTTDITNNINTVSTVSSQATETAEERAEREAKEKAEKEAKAKAEKEQKEKEEADFKNTCETYSFKEIARNPGNYKGKKVKFTGEVIQVTEGWFNSVDIRMNVTKNSYGWYDDTIYCTYTYADGESKILEDDIITIYGICEGDYTYTSVLGASITLPKVSARYVVIEE